MNQSSSNTQRGIRNIIIMNGCAGSEPYALRVLGNSMYPEFAEGEVIVIEPGFCNEHGAYIIALHNDEYIFRQLLIEGSAMYLHPLNEVYPTVRIDDEYVIKGRVVSKSSGRGRQLKSYL